MEGYKHQADLSSHLVYAVLLCCCVAVFGEVNVKRNTIPTIDPLKMIVEDIELNV